MPCPAIKQNGEVCGKRCREGEEFCGVHLRVHRNNPAQAVPNQVEIERRRHAEELRRAREITFRHRAVWNHIRDALFERMGLQLGDFDAGRRVLNANRQLPAEQSNYLDRVFPRMNQIVAGIYDGTNENPIVDAIQLAGRIRHEAPAQIVAPPPIVPPPVNLQQLLLEEQIQVARGIINIPMPPPPPRLPARELQAEPHEHAIQLDVVHVQNILNLIPPLMPEIRARPQPQGELARFVQDNQNVHTSAAVKQTKDIINRVLRIPVPAEYKSPSLKTMGEIVLECPLTKKAAWQFSSKYCADEDIYDYGAGIYARVTDCVWQYIKNSPDKADLCKIFAQELQDSVGMCAQGNLTRLCNVLAGYLDGINMESQGEQLQRRMALLMDLDDRAVRLAQGRALLAELAVPVDQHAPWLEALTA